MAPFESETTNRLPFGPVSMSVPTPSPPEAEGLSPEQPATRVRSRARSVVLENIGSARLDPARISELSGIRRSTLYHIFAAEGGVSAYVQDLRLSLVNSDLQDPAFGTHQIATLAERRGFHNASSFNRAFRSKFGRTPGNVRAAALARSSDSRPPEETLRSVRDLLD